MANAFKRMTQEEEEDASRIIKKYERLYGDRGVFNAHCTEIAERMMPSHKDLFQTRGSLVTKGAKKNEFIFDATASIALGRFAAILDSLLTPRNQTWHRLMASDPVLNRNRSIQLWFEQVNKILFLNRYSPKANFSSQNQQNYKSLGAYGSGCMFVDKLRQKGEKGLRYRNIHLSEIFFIENHQGIVDGVIRYFSMTARQAVQKWGDKVPESIANATDQEKEFFFINCVEPREDDKYDPQRVDAKGMRYGSYYISMEGRHLIEEGGYQVFPYPTSRYEQIPGEVYGRSPAMDVLPAVKTLNEQKKTLLKAGHRAVDPILLTHDDGIVNTFSMKPGALNSGGVTADGRPLVHALPIGKVELSKELMDDERSQINDAFLISIFQIMVESPQMSATEVLERTKEKGILLAPTIGRQQSEYLGPMIERELDVLAEQKLLPPMPTMLKQAKGQYRIEYDSPLSRAQRAEEASGLMRTVETLLNIVNITQDPSALDFLDLDVAGPEIAEIQGVPHRWLKSDEDIKAVRDQRQKAHEIQQASQVAPGAAAMIKAVGKQKGAA